ncbi:MAG: BrnT family toxin [Deltaproteobacteria bacterium]|nr:BrnT family toxin [Deltaproteobacteria bacterium]
MILVVCHCFRESETVIRLISARKADKGEQQEYWRRKR